jgi:hypothetical protein
MSHTFKTGDTWFIFNSDLSGPLTVGTRYADGDKGEIVISASELMAFAREMIGRAIDSFEDEMWDHTQYDGMSVVQRIDAAMTHYTTGVDVTNPDAPKPERKL